MARSFRDASRTFADRALQFRQLEDDRQQKSLANAAQMAELQAKGITFTPQVTQGPRRLFGLIPGQTRRSLSVSYDPTMNPDYQKKQLETQKLQKEVDSYDQPLRPGFTRLPGGRVTTDPDYFNEENEKKKAEIRANAADQITRGRMRAKQEEEPVPPAQMGIDTLAGEAEQLVPKAVQTLFPDNTPKSYRRDLATESKGLFGQKLPLTADAQNVRRWLGQALAAKLLIQTGVAESPGQYQRLAENYLAGFTSNPEALLPALQELQTFYGNYRKGLRTRGKEGFSVEPKQGNQVPEWVPENYDYVSARNAGLTDEEIKAEIDRVNFSRSR